MRVESNESIRGLGEKNPQPHWDRFNRLQANAELVAGIARHPKGVFRFKTWEEFNEWKMKCRILARSSKSRFRSAFSFGLSW